MIKHEGNKWVLYSKDGDKVLGKHDTKEDAIKQEVAIKISKKKSLKEFINEQYKLVEKKMIKKRNGKWVYLDKRGNVTLERDSKEELERVIDNARSAQKNPVAKNDFNRGGFHKEKSKRDTRQNSKQKLKKTLKNI